MQNQLYEELLGLPQLQVNAVSITTKRIEIHCASKFKACHCPCCLEPTTKINQSYQPTVRDLPISGRRVYLHLTTYQFECERCKRLFYEQFSFVERNQQLTTRYEHYIYKRCIGVEFQYVVVQEDLCWKTVDRIFGTYAERESVDLFEPVRALGIDEIALKKGHSDFACVLVNLETGQVIEPSPLHATKHSGRTPGTHPPDVTLKSLVTFDLWQHRVGHSATKELVSFNHSPPLHIPPQRQPATKKTFVVDQQYQHMPCTSSM